MTDLELMQISVPFHMEGSPHGVGCHNQRLPTAAGHRIEWSAAVPALTKKSHKVSKTGGFLVSLCCFFAHICSRPSLLLSTDWVPRQTEADVHGVHLLFGITITNCSERYYKSIPKTNLRTPITFRHHLFL